MKLEKLSLITEQEKPLIKIGGKFAEDYLSLKKDIELINSVYIGLFDCLGLNNDIDSIINTLINGLNGLCYEYMESQKRAIKAGKIQVAEKYIISDNNTPEEKTKKEKGLNTHLQSLFKEICKDYFCSNGISPIAMRYDKRKLEICRKALYLTTNPTLIAIDVTTFKTVYFEYMALFESETRQLQQMAADAINRFFNGAVVITEKEFARYFVFKDGIIQINPQSINNEMYSRLGHTF